MTDFARKPIRTSPYTVYVGTAAEDIQDNSQELPITCPELLPNSYTGTVAAGYTKTTVSLQDRDGNAIASQSVTANHIVATWEGASNMRLPPMVRKGEPVEVYKRADQDKFYWRATGRGRTFRTTDRMHFEIGATDPTQPGQTKTDNNTYSMYMDSVNKKVGVKTSDSNGEAGRFIFEADLAQGTVYLSDGGDPGNRLFLDNGKKSGTPVFQVNLTSGATLKFQKDDVFLKVPGKLAIDAGDRIVINAPLTIFNVTQKGTVIINAASVVINTAKDFIATAGGVIGLKAASTKIAGVLVANVARLATAIKGPYGSDYTPNKVSDPTESSVNEARNAADTSAAGLPYRTA